MKNFIILLIAIVAGSTSKAQNNYQYKRRTNQYVATYAYGSLWGMNGFRSVEEENRIMAQQLEELKQQRILEEMTPEQRENARKNQQIKLEIRNEALQSRREKENARNAKKAAKTDSVNASKKATAPAVKAAPAAAVKEVAKPAQPVAVKKEEPKKKK